MSNPAESWGYTPEQVPQLPTAPEAPGRLDAFRTSALEAARQSLQTASERGKEGLVQSVESGTAERVGHLAIDIAAKTAEHNLKLLPPGTRLIGKFIGKRAISRLRKEGHDRLGGALDSVAARVDNAPELPAIPDAYSSMPQTEAGTSGGWGKPSAESTPSADSMEPWTRRTEPTPGWGNEPASALPPTGENLWFNQPSPPLAEISPAAKESIFKRLINRKGDASAIPPVPDATSAWGSSSETPTGWGASDVQKPTESWWTN